MHSAIRLPASKCNLTNRSLARLPACLFARSLARLFVRLLARPFVRPLTRLFARSLARLFVRLASLLSTSIRLQPALPLL